MLLTIEELKNTTHATYLSGKLLETIKFGHELVGKAILQQDRVSIRYGYMYLAVSYHALSELKNAFHYTFLYDEYCQQSKEELSNLEKENLYLLLFFLYEYNENWEIELCERLKRFEDGYFYYKEYVDILQELNQAAIYKTTLQLEIQHRVSAIQERTNLDGLTSIYNRYHLENVAKKWLLEATNEKSTVTCLVFDIDNFKSINDQYGHLIGDDVIKLVANTCKELANLETTFAARFGGDEFVILLRHLKTNEVMEFANTLNQTLASKRLPIEDSMLTFTVSMGMAMNRKGEINSFHEIFKHADMALYKAKENGRNQIRQYE
ncbi:GGDEF domain-containing protein [Viridibacillus sp. NPDC096237]|uniref:GGDEF domain-containing protein n=1 Tax=Viridibacillus sp. NPDC096237 TaxID=3390721 RepID=UPI003D06218C